MIFFDQVLEEPKRTMLRVILHFFTWAYSLLFFFHGSGFSGSDPSLWPVRIRTMGPREKKSDPDSKHCFNCELNLYRRWRPTWMRSWAEANHWISLNQRYCFYWINWYRARTSTTVPVGTDIKTRIADFYCLTRIWIWLFSGKGIQIQA